jgi:hypothetical protein
MTANGQAKEKHPKGLYVLFMTEMWERFGFYTLNAMLVLYMKNNVQGFGWSAAHAASINAYYLFLVYLTPLLGGHRGQAARFSQNGHDRRDLLHDRLRAAGGAEQRADLLPRPGLHRGGQRLLQAEHLVDGGQPL